jgi:hypothetical protein
MGVPNKIVLALGFSLAVSILVFVFLIVNVAKPQRVYPVHGFGQILTPTGTNPFPYKIPNLAYSRSYRIMLVGDSMIGSLGPNAQLLRQHLIEYYPDHEFVNYNYGFGATSIETLPNRLVNETEYNDQTYPSILSQGFDLIIVGSFAYNPLSQEYAGNGIAKHISFLNDSIRKIIQTKPDSVVAIMTPIAPSKEYFAKGVYDLTSEERKLWAEERIAYIESVINYANEKEIPLINVYAKTLSPDGDGNLKYISKDDYIHPSPEGVDLMSKTIVEFIYTNSIFPK